MGLIAGVLAAGTLSDPGNGMAPVTTITGGAITSLMGDTGQCSGSVRVPVAMTCVTDVISVIKDTYKKELSEPK